VNLLELVDIVRHIILVQCNGNIHSYEFFGQVGIANAGASLKEAMITSPIPFYFLGLNA
jgi:hypothetical protein